MAKPLILLLAALSTLYTASPVNERDCTHSVFFVSLDEAQSTKTIFANKLNGVKPGGMAVVKDCLEQIDDAVDQLRESIEELKNIGQAKGVGQDLELISHKQRKCFPFLIKRKTLSFIDKTLSSLCPKSKEDNTRKDQRRQQHEEEERERPIKIDPCHPRRLVVFCTFIFGSTGGKDRDPSSNVPDPSLETHRGRWQLAIAFIQLSRVFSSFSFSFHTLNFLWLI
ncbi:hypothetical protein OIU77_002327 [Salix suchowensis]|uniref:Pectinesterase inhibitor domain-containing protein n=1 Tax=Salix suchowensis TaxID=1278906 RepID=A0ABQ9B5R9_9ROSI|nr:hypothetical protein OIU77_002327 [Salix suchowensis]